MKKHTIFGFYRIFEIVGKVARVRTVAAAPGAAIVRRNCAA